MDAGLHRSQSKSVLIVDVGDDRNRRPGHDLGQPLGGLDLVAGDPDNVSSGSGEGVNLSQGPIDIGRFGRGHRLHGDGSTTPNGDATDTQLSSFATFDHRGGGYFAPGG